MVYIALRTQKYSHLLQKNLDTKDLIYLILSNPSIIDFEYQYEYVTIKERCLIYKEELIQKAFHPSRIQKYLDMGISIDELDNYL